MGAGRSKTDDRLKGWKEIAVFLRTSERTAQRWEKELQLPVYRHRTLGNPVVLASRQELERWIRSEAGRAARPDEACSSCEPSSRAVEPPSSAGEPPPHEGERESRADQPPSGADRHRSCAEEAPPRAVESPSCAGALPSRPVEQPVSAHVEAKTPAFPRIASRLGARRIAALALVVVVLGSIGLFVWRMTETPGGMASRATITTPQVVAPGIESISAGDAQARPLPPGTIFPRRTTFLVKGHSQGGFVWTVGLVDGRATRFSVPDGTGFRLLAKVLSREELEIVFCSGDDAVPADGPCDELGRHVFRPGVPLLRDANAPWLPGASVEWVKTLIPKPEARNGEAVEAVGRGSAARPVGEPAK